MPILALAPTASDGELGQGDLLDDVRLFETNVATGAVGLMKDVARVLVVSRDCVGANKHRAVVAPIEMMKHDEFGRHDEDKGKAYDQLKRRLATLRDGGERPDRLYLGTWANEMTRMTAHLDRLATIALPEDAAERQAWVARHRLARLTEDFLRALPVRLFWAFGKVGFDDIAWYPTRDLEAVVHAGRAYVHGLEAEVDTRTLMANTGASGDQKRNVGLNAPVEKARADLEKAKAELDRYERELKARGPEQSPA